MAVNSNYVDLVHPVETFHIDQFTDHEAVGDTIRGRMLVVLIAVMVIMPITFFGLVSLRSANAGSVKLATVSDAAVAANAGAQTGVVLTNEGIGGGSDQERVDPGSLSTVFAPEVLHWAPQIQRWAAQYELDPNLVAIIMQVESCGDPGAASSAGAQGLFQVMPFHFTAGENMTDPDTNARRGLNYFVEGLRLTDGNIGLTFAGYNGGHGTAAKNWSLWPNETQRYYTWTTGIYEDIQAGLNPSPTLEAWLAAGGAGLCRQAAGRLGLAG